MHITVTSLALNRPNMTVEFSCLQGTGRGTWKTGVPRLGQEYDVELDLQQPLLMEMNAQPARKESPRVSMSEHEVTLVARVEEVFEEGNASLRLGDALILAEYQGEFPAPGTWVEITLPELVLFDTGR